MNLIGMLKPFIKMSAPKLAKNLTSKIEVLLDETAEKNNVPPFDLNLIITEKNKQAEGIIYIKTDGLQKTLRTIDVQKMVGELFQEQMKGLPIFAQKQVKKMMNGESLDSILLMLLQESDLLAMYDDMDELGFHKLIEGKEIEKIDLEDFFTSL